MDILAVNEDICNELRRISNRLTRIAMVLETFVVASFLEYKSLAQEISNMRTRIDKAEQLKCQ